MGRKWRDKADLDKFSQGTDGGLSSNMEENQKSNTKAHLMQKMRQTEQFMYTHLHVNENYHLVQNKKWIKDKVVSDDRFPACLEIVSLENPKKGNARSKNFSMDGE